jgi:hypothetical protein
LEARLTTLFCTKITVVKCRDVKAGQNPAETCKEGSASKEAVLPMMMMMMISDC